MPSASADLDPCDLGRVEYVDVLAVGEFDEVVRLVGKEHGVGDDALLGVQHVEHGVALAVEFAKGLTEFGDGHGVKDGPVRSARG